MTMTTRPRSTGHPGYSETHPCKRQTAEIARKLVTTACAAWELESLAEPAALIVTELIANAARHTRSRHIRIVVDRPSQTFIRVAVVDRSAQAPKLRAATSDDETGRGLLLIDAYADRWGYDLLGCAPARSPWGKRVWAELRVKDFPRDN
ncbi:ATP-binding protein [Streptomyces sp. NPDC050315]|uniref:ATP-binding protein n=1 Tax=Streptomyces sp. NPDC050315 TaxID=3155039 RepID=UPI00343C66CB